MSQAGIKREAEAIRKRRQKLLGEAEVELAKLRVVQARCTHPNKYPTSCMGDDGERCPDCGWGR